MIRTRNARKPARPRRNRRGVAYVIVLGAAMLVSLFFLASIVATQIERRKGLDAFSSYQAELYARLAVDMGLFQISEDPDRWRKDFANGEWEIDQNIGWEKQPIEAASYSFQGIDPIDDDLEDSDFDHIEIIGTGKRTPAVRKLRTRMNIQLIGYDSMQSVMHAVGNIQIDNANVTADEWISSDSQVVADNNTDVYTDAASNNMPDADETSTFHGLTSEDGTWPRGVPDSNDVFEYYLANGTPISYLDLPQHDDSVNLMSNWIFDDGLTDWYGVDGTVSIDIDETKSGPNALKTTSRSDDLSGPAQDITQYVYPGSRFFLKTEIYNHYTENCDGYIRLKVESTGEGVQYFSTPVKNCEKEKWASIIGEVTTNYTGTLIKAEWMVTLEHGTAPAIALEYTIDKCIMNDLTFPDGAYVFTRRVLSPNVNPFGSGDTNPAGIYILNCAGKTIYIQDSRVVGTLVLQNSGNTVIGGSVNFSRYIFNFPVLMADNDLNLEPTNSALDEEAHRTNFNPVGTPYDGDEDADQLDTFPSELEGIVYSVGDMTLDNHPVIKGIVLSDNKIFVNGPDVELYYRRAAYNDAAPGFRGTPILTVMPGSISRETD